MPDTVMAAAEGSHKVRPDSIARIQGLLANAALPSHFENSKIKVWFYKNSKEFYVMYIIKINRNSCSRAN